MKKFIMVCIYLLIMVNSLFAIIPIPVIAALTIVSTAGTYATGTALVENNVLESDNFNVLGDLSISHVPETHIIAGLIGEPAKETNRTFYVGEYFDIFLNIRVVNRHFFNRSKPITGTITIPHTKVSYYEAVGESSIRIIDKKEDPINNATIYTFSVMSGSSKNTQKSTIRFRCIPLEAGSDVISIVYDQNVKSQYDTRDTFHYYER